MVDCTYNEFPVYITYNPTFFLNSNITLLGTGTLDDLYISTLK